MVETFDNVVETFLARFAAAGFFGVGVFSVTFFNFLLARFTALSISIILFWSRFPFLSSFIALRPRFDLGFGGPAYFKGPASINSEAKLEEQDAGVERPDRGVEQ